MVDCGLGGEWWNATLNLRVRALSRRRSFSSTTESIPFIADERISTKRDLPPGETISREIGGKT
jgi:hypothetical protein